MKKYLLLLVVLMFYNCSKQNNIQKNKKICIAVTTYPIYFLTRRITKNSANIILTYPPDKDPAFYLPHRNILKQLYNSDLIIINGAEFEKWIDKAALPNSKIVNTSENFKNEWIKIELPEHSHGNNIAHSHSGIDGHTWLSPAYLIKQTKAIFNELSTLYQEKNPEFQNQLLNNYNILQENLFNLDKDYAMFFSKSKIHDIAASHPAYNYLAKSYNFNIINFHIEPNAEPQSLSDTLQKLKKIKINHDLDIMLWESEPSKELQNTLNKAGIKNVVFSTVENYKTNVDTDLIYELRENLNRIKENL